MEYTFTKENFNQEVMNSSIPVMIDFYADWCAPCRIMAPAVAKLAEKYNGKIKIGKVNADNDPELAARFGVMGIPNFVFIKNGKAVDQAVGAQPKMMLDRKLQQLL
jgi:thioredoxin 1